MAPIIDDFAWLTVRAINDAGMCADGPTFGSNNQPVRVVAGVSDLKEWDDELAKDILTAFASLEEGVIAPLDETGDRQGARLENGRVRMPDGFAAAFARLAEMGWQGLTALDEHGGMGQAHLSQPWCQRYFLARTNPCRWSATLFPVRFRPFCISGPKPSKHSESRAWRLARRFPPCA